MSSLYSGTYNHAANAHSPLNRMSQYFDGTINNHAHGTFFFASHSASPGDSPSDRESHLAVDLDLDSLFRKLDRYTAEMEEVAVRFDREGGSSDSNVRTRSRSSSLDFDPLYAHVFRPSFTQGVAGDSGTPQSQTTPATDDSVEHTSHDQSTWRRNNGRSDENKLDSETTDSLSQQSPGVSPSTKQPPLTDPKLHLSLPKKTQRPNRGNTMPGLAAPRYPSDVQRRFYEELEYSDVDDDEPGPSLRTSWGHPPRSSSMPNVTGGSKGPKSPALQDSTLPSESVNKRNPFRQAGFWSMPTFDDEPLPPVPHLSHAGSIATLATSPPTTPQLLYSPKEEQPRRELESFAVVDNDGAETLDSRYKRRAPPVLTLDYADDNVDLKGPGQVQSHLMRPKAATDAPKSGRLRRSRSILNLFQRKCPVEKVIDLYIEDEPEAKSTRSLSRWATLSRRQSPTRAKRPTIPGPASANPHSKKLSFG
ncbi:hypothetical protein PV10_03226 [Exophiala mesophila]|uniref:Uncharacterized protein n=1 Tax=Exophiala mesophila TaxID=212818 RepID=A0A0D1X1G5_EXOME|nr:uncharacterized protein PV10_03226 [Exophiala mesophila]KIV95595.1 hypothetical protein PV10_03226 [Exophiala mesophila]